MNFVAWTWGPQGFGTYRVAGGTFERTDGVAECVLAPGFVDTHIHGGFGLDWMEQPDCLPELAEHLARVGVEFFLPTTISYPLADVRRAIGGLTAHPMIAGFHLEGPFLSRKYPGAQPESALLDPADRGPGWDEVLNDPRLRIVSMAGELPGAHELAANLTQRGVIVSQAHTDATYEQAHAAFQAGATHLTHFYNAMRGFTHREPGTVGFGLTEPAATCELIYDRVHVNPVAAQLLLQSKPADKVIAISDASKAAGMAAGTEMRMWGHDVRVGEGEVRLANGALAGSAVTLFDCFCNLAEDFGLETAMRLTSVNPRNALKLPPPRRWVELSLNLELRAVHEAS
ncbi:MAG: amidohydrolase family protein [Chthonomonas sp.]|nr:amidohydrolase family protein [Chthonomonas sp.]